MTKSQLIGAKAHAARLKRLSGEAMILEVGKALVVAGGDVKTEAQIMITTGAVSGKHHVVSKPGEPPKNDSGHLASHIESVQTAPLIVEVSSNAAYAAALEFGSSKVAARPYMRPARDKLRPDIVRSVRAAVDRAVKRSRA